MPLPATIHANVRWPSFRAAPHAIVETGGNLYVVALGSAAASSGHIAAWKSTDGGETWAEVDSADRITGIAGDSFAAVASGTTIHVAYQLLSDTAVRVRPFDCATEQWGTATGAGPALTANVGANAHVTGQIALFLCVRSDGDYVVLHQGNDQAVMGNSYRRVVYSRHEGGTWTSDVVVDPSAGTQVHYDARTAILGSSDRVHLFYSNGT
jgi:hypothetical protein